MRKATHSGTTEGFFENHRGQLHQVCRAVFCFSGVDSKGGGSGREVQGGYESFAKDGALFEVGDDDGWRSHLLPSIASAWLLGLEQREQFGFSADWTPQGT